MKVEMKREEWLEPKLTGVGDVSEVIQGGGGKLSLSAEDSGDSGKPTGSEPT